MLDHALLAQAIEALQSPRASTPEREELIYAWMTAESLKLSGIETSVEEILELVRSERCELMTPEERSRLRGYYENDVREMSAKQLFETVERLSHKDNAEDFQRERCQYIESKLRSRILEINNQLSRTKGDVSAIQEEKLEHTEALKQVRDILKGRDWDPPVFGHLA